MGVEFERVNQARQEGGEGVVAAAISAGREVEEREERGDDRAQRTAFSDDAMGVAIRNALGSLGLPPSTLLAIPATVDDPLPESWIWALRLRAMFNDGDR